MELDRLITNFKCDNKSFGLNCVDSANSKVYQLFGGKEIACLKLQDGTSLIKEKRYSGTCCFKTVALLIILVTLPILIVTLSIKIFSSEDKRLAAYFSDLKKNGTPVRATQKSIDLKKEVAASKIKASWRVYKKRNDAAVTIQDACRMYQTRKKRAGAAVTIQDACRMYRTRKKKRNDAATLIRSACRTYTSQKRNEAADRIKTAYKIYRAYKKNLEAKDDYGQIEMEEKLDLGWSISGFLRSTLPYAKPLVYSAINSLIKDGVIFATASLAGVDPSDLKMGIGVDKAAGQFFK